MIFVGNDWSEGHHELYVMGESGTKLVARQLREGIEGLAELHRLLAPFVSDPGEVVVGIETDRGLWVQALVAAGYGVYALNPKSVARYRERHHPGGGKSDSADAKLLADLVRTDRHNHRPLAGDSPEVEAIKVLARAHQSLIWAQQRHSNRLRSGLREYYPAALATFPDLCDRGALEVLAKAPTPAQGRRLTIAQLRAALAKAGRQRRLASRAEEIRAGLRTEALEASPQIGAALAAVTQAEVAVIRELGEQIAALEKTLAEGFEEHPDADLFLSLPGVGSVLGARMLGEFGDDPNRYPDAKSRRNYAATSPLTIASGKKEAVIARPVRPRWLHQAATQWAFCSLRQSPGAKAFYDRRRKQGDSHRQALRILANRWVGILHGCLRHKTPYDEETAWQLRPGQPFIPTAA